jgi:hypothetical protein
MEPSIAGADGYDSDGHHAVNRELLPRSRGRLPDSAANLEFHLAAALVGIDNHVVTMQHFAIQDL